MEKKDATPYIVGIVAILFAFALCFSTAVWMLTEMLKADTYIKVDGVIIDKELHETWDSDGNYNETYYNLIEYEVDGKKYQRLTETHNSIWGHDKIGDPYTLYYNPDNPKDVVFKTPDRYLLTTVMFAFSAAFFAGEIVVICKFIKFKKK